MSRYAYRAGNPDWQEMDGPDSDEIDRWEDDVPDHWYAVEAFEEQYERTRPDWDERPSHG